MPLALRFHIFLVLSQLFFPAFGARLAWKRATAVKKQALGDRTLESGAEVHLWALRFSGHKTVHCKKCNSGADASKERCSPMCTAAAAIKGDSLMAAIRKPNQTSFVLSLKADVRRSFDKHDFSRTA